MYGSWTVLIEVAGLRRDGTAFGRLTLAVPTLARGISTLYARFFDDVGFRDRRQFPACRVEYYRNGRLHCSNAAALQYENGCCDWIINNNLHRIDGPARIDKLGVGWWCDGRKHRADGPADVDIFGNMHWYAHGIELESPIGISKVQACYKMFYCTNDELKTNPLFRAVG